MPKKLFILFAWNSCEKKVSKIDPLVPVIDNEPRGDGENDTGYCLDGQAPEVHESNDLDHADDDDDEDGEGGDEVADEDGGGDEDAKGGKAKIT